MGFGGPSRQEKLVWRHLSKLFSAAFGADAVDLHSVLGLGKIMFGGNARCPAFDRWSLYLHGLRTGSADEMVVMGLGDALAETGFAVAAAQNIEQAVVGHGLQEAVDGRQRNLLLGILQPAMQLLGRGEIVDLAQGLSDSQSLLGDPGFWLGHLRAPFLDFDVRGQRVNLLSQSPVLPLNFSQLSKMMRV